MILVDTGIFIAAGDRNEPSHQSCGDLLRSRADLAIVATVVAETAWLIEDRLGPHAEASFLRLVTSARFDIVDLDLITAENGSIEFLLAGAQTAIVGFDEFTGVTWGDNSANHIDLGEVGAYDEIVITMGGSGGVDNLLMTVPEPGTLALTSLGLVGLAVRRRRHARR